jgi:citrate synthase
MSGAQEPMARGLHDVIAADTVLSHSDPQNARLWIRGRPLHEAVHVLGYEGAVALLWEGFAGAGRTREQIRASLGAARQHAFDRLGNWLQSATGIPPNEAMKTWLATLPDGSTPDEIAGAIAVGVGAILRQRSGLRPVPPDPALSGPADILRMMRGEPASPACVQALETYFTVVMENGLGASSFAARVIASTRASLSSAVLGAYCAFTGPLHGGAPGPVLDMLDEARASGDVDAWLERRLAAGERLPGFGNRAFPHGDPRADLLGEALRRLAPDTPLARFAAEFEQRALAALARHHSGRALHPNLELNAALLLDACGIPRDAFTPVFAAARVAGWLAHALEQQQSGRMIRPTSRYVGPDLA